LDINGVTDVLASSGGFTIVQLTSRTTQSFEQAQPTIQSTLASRDAFFSEKLSNAKIEVNPRYGVYQPADATSGASASIVPTNAVALSEDPVAGPAASGGSLTNGASGNAGSGGAASPQG